MALSWLIATALVAYVSTMTGMPAAQPTPQAFAAAGSVASATQMDMGSPETMSAGTMAAHMRMTPARDASASDRARATRIIASLRVAIKPYADYRVAEAAGYKPFHPEWPLRMYHFTNMHNALLNEFSFDPGRPTSLMYKKVPSGYELEGAMYTAPRSATFDQLDERVPLSIATWHEHTNLCLPPGMGALAFGFHAKFGLAGSIATADACSQAGGTFIPVIYNWMVHVWPFETDPAKMWATADDPGTEGH